MDDDRKPSLKDKIKQSLCFSCCFRVDRRETLHAGPKSSGKENHNLIGASSQWIRSRTVVDLPEIKDKCRKIFGRIGGSNGLQSHRRRHSSDFRYDPLSYSLNFEDESYMYLNDDSPSKGFSYRLPTSPPSSTTDAPSHLVATVS